MLNKYTLTLIQGHMKTHSQRWESYASHVGNVNCWKFSHTQTSSLWLWRAEVPISVSLLLLLCLLIMNYSPWRFRVGLDLVVGRHRFESDWWKSLNRRSGLNWLLISCSEESADHDMKRWIHQISLILLGSAFSGELKEFFSLPSKNKLWAKWILENIINHVTFSTYQ